MRSFALCILSAMFPAALLPSHAWAAQPHASAFPTRTTPALAPGDTVDNLAARLATITTDTGAFAPGHRDFSRYDTPGLCRAAARVTRASFRLSLAAQASGDTLSEDTIGVGGTAPVARACGAHFTLATATARELGDLFDLALHEQNDTLAQAVLAKLLAQDATSGARDDTYVFGMRSYLTFGRLAAAEALLAQFDAQGPAARIAQLAVHDQMLSFFSGRGGDTMRIRREAERRIAQGRKRVAHEPSYQYELEGYRTLMFLAVQQHSTVLPALTRRAQSDLRQFTSDDHKGLPARDRGDWGTFSVDTVISRLAPERSPFHP